LTDCDLTDFHSTLKSSYKIPTLAIIKRQWDLPLIIEIYVLCL